MSRRIGRGRVTRKPVKIYDHPKPYGFSLHHPGLLIGLLVILLFSWLFMGCGNPRSYSTPVNRMITPNGQIASNYQ